MALSGDGRGHGLEWTLCINAVEGLLGILFSTAVVGEISFSALKLPLLEIKASRTKPHISIGNLLSIDSVATHAKTAARCMNGIPSKSRTNLS
jgi:hypothetical protein